MEDGQNTIMLPYILEILRRQPGSTMTVFDLQETLKKYFESFEIAKYEFAIKVGKNMGLFALPEDRVRLRFSYGPVDDSVQD